MLMISIGGDFLTGARCLRMDSYFLCKACDYEYDSDSCEVHDILESLCGRLYLFICPMCNQEQTSELIIEDMEAKPIKSK